MSTALDILILNVLLYSLHFGEWWRNVMIGEIKPKWWQYVFLPLGMSAYISLAICLRDKEN